jgi:hypothetical protein
MEIQSVSRAPQLGESEAGSAAAPVARATAVISGVPAHVLTGIRIRMFADLTELTDVTVNVPDSLPVAVLVAIPIPLAEVASSRNSTSDAPQEENSLAPPEY